MRYLSVTSDTKNYGTHEWKLFVARHRQPATQRKHSLLLTYQWDGRSGRSCLPLSHRRTADPPALRPAHQRKWTIICEWLLMNKPGPVVPWAFFCGRAGLGSASHCRGAPPPNFSWCHQVLSQWIHQLKILCIIFRSLIICFRSLTWSLFSMIQNKSCESFHFYFLFIYCFKFFLFIHCHNENIFLFSFGHIVLLIVYHVSFFCSYILCQFCLFI